jgi:hypothetical protein
MAKNFRAVENSKDANAKIEDTVDEVVESAIRALIDTNSEDGIGIDFELNTKLWTDGSLATSIWPNQWVGVRRADCTAKFILLRESYSFYQTLRDKLQWAGADHEGIGMTGGSSAAQSRADGGIEGFLERPAGLMHGLFQELFHILIEGDGGSSHVAS